MFHPGGTAPGVLLCEFQFVVQSIDPVVGAAISRPRGTMLRIRRKPMRKRKISLHGRLIIAPTLSTVHGATNINLPDIVAGQSPDISGVCI